MFNNIGAKPYRHNITELYRRFIMIDPRIKIDCERYPSWIPIDAIERQEPADKFINRLGVFGNPNIRYLELGYDIQSADLFKLDNLVWQIRRHCCKLSETSERKLDSEFEPAINIELINKDKYFNPIRGKIEGLISSDNEYLKKCLQDANYAFDPDGAKHSRMYAAGRSSMLQWTIHDLDRRDFDPVKAIGAKITLEWINDYMPTKSNDTKSIKRLIN